jgi:hypothetical protein
LLSLVQLGLCRAAIATVSDRPLILRSKLLLQVTRPPTIHRQPGQSDDDSD